MKRWAAWTTSILLGLLIVTYIATTAYLFARFDAIYGHGDSVDRVEYERLLLGLSVIVFLLLIVERLGRKGDGRSGK